MYFIISLFLCTVLCLQSCNKSDASIGTKVSTHKTQEDSTIKLIFVGDMMSHMPQVKAAWNPLSNTYEYKHWFQYIIDTISQADITIANLETPLAGEPYSGYPQFSAPDAFAMDLQAAGFDVLVTSNNHTVDKGFKGLSRTLDILDTLHIMHTGSFRSQIEKDSLYPLIIIVKGISIALLNYTYGTNGIPVPKPGIVNLINKEMIAKDIAKAKLLGAKIIIPIMHWGVEYQTKEHSSQTQIASYCKELGADAVIGMHPHVVQPIRYISNNQGTMPVAYSLGNALANMRERYKDGGIMVECTISKVSDTVRIISTKDIPFWVWKGKPKHQDRIGYYMIPESFVDSLPPQDKKQAQLFFKDTRLILGKTQ